MTDEADKIIKQLARIADAMERIEPAAHRGTSTSSSPRPRQQDMPFSLFR